LATSTTLWFYHARQRQKKRPLNNFSACRDVIIAVIRPTLNQATGFVHVRGAREHNLTLQQMAVPEVDRTDGLPPAVALQQQRGSPTTRSSVRSVTTLSNLLRMLYSRAGHYPA
jgi:hypothetical protein